MSTECKVSHSFAAPPLPPYETSVRIFFSFLSLPMHGCENWERYDFMGLLRLVKSFILLNWDTRKNYMVIRTVRVQHLVALALVL